MGGKDMAISSTFIAPLYSECAPYSNARYFCENAIPYNKSCYIAKVYKNIGRDELEKKHSNYEHYNKFCDIICCSSVSAMSKSYRHLTISPTTLPTAQPCSIGNWSNGKKECIVNTEDTALSSKMIDGAHYIKFKNDFDVVSNYNKCLDILIKTFIFGGEFRLLDKSKTAYYPITISIKDYIMGKMNKKEYGKLAELVTFKERLPSMGQELLQLYEYVYFAT